VIVAAAAAAKKSTIDNDFGLGYQKIQALPCCDYPRRRVRMLTTGCGMRLKIQY
jgi:hypothetical protein